jgi:hypothetical protein
MECRKSLLRDENREQRVRRGVGRRGIPRCADSARNDGVATVETARHRRRPLRTQEHRLKACATGRSKVRPLHKPTQEPACKTGPSWLRASVWGTGKRRGIPRRARNDGAVVVETARLRRRALRRGARANTEIGAPRKVWLHPGIVRPGHRPANDTRLGAGMFNRNGSLAQADAVEGVHGGHVGEDDFIADF